MQLLDPLEARVVLAAPPAVLLPPAPLTLLDPKTVPQFVNKLPNPLTDLAPYTPVGKDGGKFDHYEITQSLLAGQDLGLGPDPVTGLPRLTDVFAYGNPSQTPAASYPGRTFEVRKGTPISVTWTNDLPQQHVVPIDPTVLPGDITFVPPVAGASPTTATIAEGIPAVPHLHGGHTDAAYDGTPMQYWTKGHTVEGADYETDSYVYANDQDAATLWYHDHAMGVTRLNAYAGLAGFYLIRDTQDTGQVDNPMGLPAGDYEVPIAIQDKQFLSDGKLWYPAMASATQANVASMMPEMFGDVILANGQAWPKLDVQPKRYRLRLLNGSDSRFYTMSLNAVTNQKTGAVSNATIPMWQIGSEHGFLNAPVPLTQLTLAPGERVDVIVDFSGIAAGKSFILTNTARSPFPGGTPVTRGLTDRIMKFDVIAADTNPDPSRPLNLLTLRAADDQVPPPTVPPTVPLTKQMALYESLDGQGRILPMLGDLTTSKTFMDDPEAYDGIAPGDQMWEIYNTTPDAHPIHLHLVKFQLISRQAFKASVAPTGKAGPDNEVLVGIVPGSLVPKGAPVVPAGAELAYKDTIQIMPGEVVRVRADFDLPGKYVWHCHILSHEEHDMMRFFQVAGDAAPRNVYQAAATPLLASFGTTRIGAGDVTGGTPEDTVAGSAAADLLV